ncbi:MAG TPA: PAS domain-containing protein, partial [Burkholderiaceae bacterium]|nr:PAS domain-containing protein [Burkholderiaceae bacterium]
MADSPTTSQRPAKPKLRAAGTPAAAPEVVSEERALALGLPGAATGALPAQPGAPTDAQTTVAPPGFVAPNAADDATILAARPADTVIETLLAAAHIGLCLLDRDLAYRFWNNCLEELFEVPADAVLGHAVGEVNGFNQIPDLIAELNRIREGDERTAQEREYQLPRAQRRWVRVKMAPVFAFDGGFDGVLITCEQIDRERFAQHSLGALRHALQAVGEMVFEIDQRGAVVDANDAAVQRLGYERDSLKGMLLGQIDASLADG